jgi:hypothetical protein
MYEYVTLKNEKKMELIRRHGFRFYSDLPRCLLSTVDAGTMQTVNYLTIPKGTKVFMLTFMKSQQLFPKSTSNKSPSARFRWPINGKRLTLELEEKGSFFFDRGFEEIGTALAYNQDSSRWYWEHLVEKKLYDLPYETLFCKGATDFTSNGNLERMAVRISDN